MHREREYQHVESVLLTHPAVGDCTVLERRTTTGESELVAYVMPVAPCTPQDLSAFLQSGPIATVVPRQFVAVSSIPLASNGHVDAARLESLSVIDEAMAARWEASVQRLAGVEHAASVIDESRGRAWPLHLSDVLPGWTEARSNPATEQPSPPKAGACLPASSRVPAISEGPPLHTEPGAPVLLGEALRLAAEAAPPAGLVYIESDGAEVRQPYAALLERAERTMSGLRGVGLTPGDRVVLQLERHQDFIEAFWACVLGGFVPVPLAVPPSYERSGGPLETLRGAWPSLGASAVLTDGRALGGLAAAVRRLQLDGARVYALEDLRGEPDTRHHRAEVDDVTLLMLTSGSTGIPKAVMLTHRNLLARSIGSRQLNGLSRADVTLNWMPLDHVAGLIYFHIRDVYLACRQVHVPTSIVLQDPLKWLDYLERYRATITFAPNFAFGLVNDHEHELAARTWDLSSVRMVLNGAEAIVPKTARTFLRLLAPHRLAPTCMHPAWGMSETSSGVTYSDSFALAHTSDEDAFVEVGRPIPGVAIRIVDAQDRIVHEGEVGRLQIRGATVTSGYFNNPELTRESFSPDGWFITGDLGIIRANRLTITGREKDVVIVNSVNYYCHTIEAVVEQLDDVETSYTAACAVRRGNADTDSLAIFFHPRCSDANALADLLARIRSEVSAKVGIAPDYVVPVEAAGIPKTSLGKIQRVELGRRLLAGDFDDTLKYVDRLLANANTIPDWFFRKVWRRKTGVSSDSVFEQHPAVLILMDPHGVGDHVRTLLEARGARCITVRAADSLARLGARDYCLNPRCENDYARLVAGLAEDGDTPAHVVQLWGYGEYGGSPMAADIEDAQVRGALSAMWLTQALAPVAGEAHPLRVTFVGSHLQRVHPHDPVAYEKSPVLGLIKSIPQEVPWIQCRHVDIFERDPSAAAKLVVDEMYVVQPDREVAYRDGQRFVARLERVAFRPAERREPHFTAGGMYLLSGGTGGIGQRTARYLLEQYGAFLLLIGRSEREGRPASVVASLARAGGCVAYETADVCDESRVAEVVARYETLWGRPLQGVIHLSGTYHESSVVAENADTFCEALRPKTVGTAVLHRVLDARGAGVFVSSSSVAAFFGGANIGAYAAANAFQEAFAEHHRERSRVEHYCFSWSNWEGVGQSAAYQIKDLPKLRGYHSMAAGHALQSLLVGLAFREHALLVGLDGRHRYVRRHVVNDSDALDKIILYYTTDRTRSANVDFGAVEVRDRFGVASQPEIVRLREMPIACTGQVDKLALARIGRGPGRSAGATRPRTEMERRLADIWTRVLAVPDVSLDDNFFDLGGDSLLALRLVGRVREECAIELTVRDLFDTTTLEHLAATISSREPMAPAAHRGKPALAAAAAPAAAAIHPERLLERLDDLTDDEVDALLTQLVEPRVSEHE